MAQLILSEKPDAASRIASALADTKPTLKTLKGVKYYELKHNEKDILVASTVGHLFNLREKNKQGLGYPCFDLEWAPSYEISKNAGFTKKYFDVLTELTKKADSYIVATDYDTEGALIGWNCIKFIYHKNDAYRMKFSTLVNEEIIESYENASKHLDFPLILAGETRHFLDHFYGVNSSKALMSAIKKSGMFMILSSGRVQSPILNILAHKEKEISNFQPQLYWELLARLNIKDQEIIINHKAGKMFNKKKADDLYNKCKNGKAKVISVKRKQYELNPEPAFNITSLQTESYKNFKYSPKKTLDIAQSLYLKAHTSYPRTSSEKLDPKIDYKAILKSLAGISLFRNFADIVLSKKVLQPVQGRKTDPAHISIYPTKEIPKLDSLSIDQKNIYSLIVKRFISTFANPAIRESMEVSFDIDEEIFLINGTRTIKPEWISIYEPYAKFKEVSIPGIKEKEEFEVKELKLEEDKTKPPKRYTQGSIIVEMEKKNLGTRATRAGILQILYDRHYIEDKSITVTELGKAVSKTLEVYASDLVSEKLTRHFEKELEQIMEGKKTKEQILKEAQKVLTNILGNMKKNEKEIGKFLFEALKETRDKASIVGKCIKCGNDLKILYSKKTKKKFVACSNYPKCENTYSLPQGKIIPTEKTCEYCKTPIIKVVREGKRPFEMCLTYNCKSKESWNSNSKPQRSPLQLS